MSDKEVAVNTHRVSSDLEVDKRLKWKRDLLLLPVLGTMYMLLFLDRTNIANARIEGLEIGLNMPPTGYNTALWIFYIPFILAEIPSNLILISGKIKPNLFLGGQMFLLGILGMCQGLTASYQGLWAIRFLMGTFESALPAGAAYMLSMYYTKRESSIRFAWFFNFALAGPMFSGLLAYAIVSLDGAGGLEGWRWIFVIEGLMTVVIAGICTLLLPDFPQNAQSWFLKSEERDRLIDVLEASRGAETKGSAIDQIPLWKVLIDWRIHLFAWCFFCCDITASSIAAFAPTILTELGWKSTTAQLMSMPIWASGIVASLSATWLAARINLRAPFVLGGICFQLVGWIIMHVYVPQPGVRYMALFFMSTGTFSQMPLLLGWLSANLRGRKFIAVGVAWVIGFGNCANFISSNIFFKWESPRYPTGFTTGLVFTIIGFFTACSIWALLVWKNKRRISVRRLMSEEEKERDDEVHFKFVC
ncbi:hypothetical protein N8I77_006596 [Diaporthe amygdali]|uniref:Major facilitator superfamily (MFS) profile domain-containing protein n=1 Tax=Phomopsis amygdali TaxID=1214568 RepID=A0AAD9W5W3_PHOAM|nr:hypothetical protein N8I77_006596 [Diaporthe amygdali]